jgi:IS4 transposase
LTSLPVNNYGDAFLVINYYSKRWHIENYFKVLKDGCCKVERTSLRTFEKLEKYVFFP